VSEKYGAGPVVRVGGGGGSGSLEDIVPNGVVASEGSAVKSCEY